MLLLAFLLAFAQVSHAMRWPNHKYCMPTNANFPNRDLTLPFLGLPFSSSDVLEASLAPGMDVFQDMYTIFGVGLNNGTLKKLWNWSHPLPGTRVSKPAINDDGTTYFLAFSERRPSNLMIYTPTQGTIGKIKVSPQVEYYDPELALYGNGTMLISSLVPFPNSTIGYTAILQAIDLASGNEIWRFEQQKSASARVILRVSGKFILWLYGDRFYRINDKGQQVWEHIVVRQDPDPRKGASTYSDFAVIPESEQVVVFGFSAGCFYSWLFLDTGKSYTNRVFIKCDGSGSLGIQRILVDKQTVIFNGAMDYHAYATTLDALPKLIFNVPARGVAALTCGGGQSDLISFSYPANMLYRWDGRDGDYMGKWQIPGGAFGKRCNGGAVFGDNAAVFNCKNGSIPETTVVSLSLIV